MTVFHQAEEQENIAARVFIKCWNQDELLENSFIFNSGNSTVKLKS